MAQGFIGRVTNGSTGFGIASAQIRFYGCAVDFSTKPPTVEAVERATVSDIRGNYSARLPVGVYRLWVKQAAFEEFRSKPYLLLLNQIVTVNIPLTQSPITPIIPATTVYVIRHAEYTLPDTHLNQAGRDRAQQLLAVYVRLA
jgi:hypothetical protein